MAAKNEYPAPGHDIDIKSTIIDSEEDDDVPVDDHGNNCNNYGGSHSNAHHLANDEPHYGVNAITNAVTITSTATTDNTNIHNSTNHHLDDNNNNSSSIPRTTSVIDQSKYSRPGRPKYAAQSELYHGMILYLSAILIPSLPRYIHQLYIRWVSSTYCRILHEQVLWCVWVLWRIGMFFLWKVRRWMVGSWMVLWSRITLSSSTVSSPPQLASTFSSTTSPSLGSSSGLVPRRLGRKIRKYIFSTSTAALWEEFNRQQQQIHPSIASTRFNNTNQRYLFVPPSIRIMVLQDMQLLIFLSIILAIVRVWFVHMLVPEYLIKVRQLEALTRCKSSHLLSNSSQNLLSLGGGGGGGNCSGSTTAERPSRLGGNERVVGGGGQESVGAATSSQQNGWPDRIRAWTLSHLHRLQPSINRALGHEPSERYDDIVEQQQQRQPHHDHRQQQQLPTLLRRSNSTPTQQLFSAPRHATATFRLLFTSISCLSALSLFQTAEFWPRAVFGTHPNASTRHCWDLSGSFSALGLLDDDYDAKNGALKYFFLAQAAYQLQSLCFHFVSMVLLLFYGGSGGCGGTINMNLLAKVYGGRRRNEQIQNEPKQNTNGSHEHQQRDPLHKRRSRRLVSMKTSMQSYFRPMMEHVIVLAILIGAYLFSGMRRLCAVGIFTLELSSVFLQLLQVCIYAPEGSWLRNPRVVLFVHRILTVPTFVYCRLIVLPFILWRSALFESHEWLEQIEKVFSPGWAERLYALFNGSLCLIFALNLILFRRLLFILRQK